MNSKQRHLSLFLSVGTFLALLWWASLTRPAQAAAPSSVSYSPPLVAWSPGPRFEAPSPVARPDAATREALQRLPLRFIVNAGLSDPAVRFTVADAGQALSFAENEVVFSAEGATVRLRFPGASPYPVIEGLDRQSGAVGFFLGNDPTRWRSDVPAYSAIAYRDLYSGIDLVYRGAGGRLKSEFVVAPGADPARIVLQYSGLESLRLRPDGALVLRTPLGEWTDAAPALYQEGPAGSRRTIAGGYRLTADQVSIWVGAYDPALPLIIDPATAYETYVGGSGWDQAYGIAVDAAGNAYVTGVTDSFDFPTTSNATQPTIRSADAFVTQIISTSGVYTYGFSTYLGGSRADWGRSIAVDDAGNIYVAGWTESNDFPTRNAVQPTLRGGTDGFVTQFIRVAGDATHETYTLGFSTYLGTGGHAYGVAVDSTGSLYVTGDTTATLSTTPNAPRRTFGGGSSDAFVTQFIRVGGIATHGVYTYGYSTYLGGGADEVGSAVAVDSAGRAFVIGQTNSTDFPTTPDALQRSYGGGAHDAFVTQVISVGGVYTWGYSTYLGGSEDDSGSGLAVDGAGNAYLTGYTNSAGFPVRNAVQPVPGGGSYDAFVTQLIGAAGTQSVGWTGAQPVGWTGAYTLGYSTFLGGGGWDQGWSVAVDHAGNAVVTGFTESTDFPTRRALQARLGGNGARNAFVTKIISATGVYTYAFSTYLGGDFDDIGSFVALDGDGTPYVTGFTASRNFPTTSDALQSVYGGDPRDAFVVRLGALDLQLKSAPFHPSKP